MYLLILAGAIVSANAFTETFRNFATTNCTDNEFFCGNFECVPLSKQCDGTTDCPDGSDELDCEMYQCKAPDFFKCENQQCISSAFVCDSQNDCNDFSDEKNCADFLKNLSKNTTCLEEEWQCTNKLCIPKEWVCNGQTDCPDGSDEHLGCSTTIVCDGFKCKNGHCVFNEWKCDGHDDCRDNSDEENCDAQVEIKNCNLENDHFLCADGKTCVAASKVCDNITHCPDKSDESSFCLKTCENCNHHCIQSPTGPKCICPNGYRTTGENHCEDINECETYGICDQKCKNVPGSYQCFCEENYSLLPDKKSCKAHFGEATMFFSSKKEIRGYFLRSQVYFTVAKNLKQVVGVDFDGHYVYWTDIFSEHESIVRSLKNGDKKEVVVSAGLGAPEDLHVDFITGNIYFTDAERQHLGVCNHDGTHCTILNNQDVHKPRGIVLNPLEGEMYWTDWGNKPEIARSYMDGSNPSSFVTSDIHWPNGLTIDHPNSRLYWTDAKAMSLESIRLDGTDRRTVLKDIVKHPYSIAVFENRLYWSDWATHSIESCDKFTGKNHRTIVKEQKDYIYGLSIYHPNNYKKTEFNPCMKSMCSDICLLKGTSYTCACPQDKELSVDGHTCREIEKKQKLVLGIDSMLVEVEHQFLGKHVVEILSVVVKKLGALAYNSVENIIYVSDLDSRKIIEVDLHTGVPKISPISDLGQVIGMDYDYLGNNLYWCDSERGTVEVFNFNTKSRTVLLHDMKGEIPESIALVPEEGVMFVAFHHQNQRSHIDRIFMDGTHRTHPLEHGFLGPISLSYDFTLHRVFIADAGTGNIETTSVEGDDRHGFRALQTAPVGIASLKKDIFWVNYQSKELFWADKFNTDSINLNKKITLDLPQVVERMHMVSVTPRRIGLSPCQHNNGGCSHLCLQSQKKIMCLCPIGMVLEKDNQTCIKRMECTSDEFFCSGANACIFKKYRCDGFNHCPNGEDEIDCKKANHCSLNNFQCDDGECIDVNLVCNSKFDCRDKSDERNCTHTDRKCPENHFMCHNGVCINQHMVCDGIKDCLNEEDEANCVQTVCRDKEFRCASGACISKSWECDHDFDCLDFSDEHPGCPSCDSSSFSCNNGKCIDKAFVCDNENDCGDNSDESACIKTEETCKVDEFACSVHSTICLPQKARCNGTSECPNNADEANCSENCHADEFYCKNKKCIPREWVCDHSDDCGDSSDEEKAMCNHTIPTQNTVQQSCENKFHCKTGNCIDYKLVCNGVQDCFDGSDEDGVCNSSCNALNNPCDHLCVRTPTGPACNCDSGYHLQGDSKSCEDINECEDHHSPCSQICHNVPGFYICDCYEGYALKTDRISCKAEGKAMSLIFVAENQIREMSQKENGLKLIYSEDILTITGLDVSEATKSIYFSVEKSGTIVKINQETSKHEFLEDVGQPQKIALDWTTNNIYYANNDPTSKSISVCNFEDKSCANLIAVDLHRQVSAIALDATNKYLFYSLVSWWTFNSPNYVIYRTNLDGTETQELVKSSSGFITGLTFDLYKKELFYVDQHQNQLFRINYDGSKKALLASNITRPNGLSFFENQLFYQSSGFMWKCRTYSSISCDSFRFKSELFTIVQESKQPKEISSCLNNTCTHLCIATKSHYKCLCEDGKLVLPEQECDSNKRESNSDGGRKILSIHHHQHYSGHSGAIVAGIVISLCLLIFGGLLFYIARRRNSGTFNVISMRFNNPGYGLEQNDESEKSILTPGQHEYSNPAELFECESNRNKKEVLINVS